MTKRPHEKIAESIARQVSDQARDLIDDFPHPTGSPIEVILLTALAMEAYCGLNEFSGCYFVDSDEQFEALQETASRTHQIIIHTQCDVGDWRVDALVHYFDWAAGRPDGNPQWRKFIVECDGHDFHERTKIQAARDRSRDRRLQHSDIPVLRFTGSEIWKDPSSCAREILSYAAKGL